MKCVLCGGDLRVIDTPNGVDRFQCSTCLRDAQPVPDPAIYPPPPPRILLLRIRWKTGFLSARELTSLRKLSPRAIGMSAAAIWSESKEEGWLLGEFDEAEADRLEAQCIELGLSVSTTLSPSSPRIPEPTRVRVRVQWRSERPSLQEVLALRAISEEAAAMTTPALLKRAREGQWLLGEFWPHQVVDLARCAEGVGLQLFCED